MADTDAKPMTDANVGASPAPRPAEPVKGPVDNDIVAGEESRWTPSRRSRMVRLNTARRLPDRVRTLADTGKGKAVEALGHASTLLDDAARQVDEKFGAQYGDYARTAASQINALSDGVRAKDIDELVGDARQFVRTRPGVAIGVAAAVGFVVARLVQSGIDGGEG